MMHRRVHDFFQLPRNEFIAVCLAAVCSLAISFVQAQPPVYIWLEAEKPDETNVPTKVSTGPRGELLSGGAWLLDTLSKEEVTAGKLGKGRHFAYCFQVTQPGVYRLWIRLGYEFVRPPLSWRIDDNPWQQISPEDLTTNLIELDLWCEAGWLSPGVVLLAEGTHTLELQTDKPGRDGRFLLALDAIALVQGDWTPEDKLKPGEVPETEIDRQAAQQVFRFDTKETERVRQGMRGTLSLNGLWQVCRHDDPDMDKAPYEPVRDFPKNSRWRGIQVPSNLRSVPALDMAHRVWYRCRVEIPKEWSKRSFFLDFTGTNWIASVVVNGEFIGAHKSTRIPWRIDITRAIQPGQVNEILVGIKDVWYAIDAAFHKTSLDENRNRPIDAFRWTRFVAPVYPSTKGDADGTECGITDPVALIVSGPVYVEDVFVQTSVAQKSIIVDIKLRNTTPQTVQATLQAEAVLESSRQVERRFEPQRITVPAGETSSLRLTDSWPNPKLWWPGDDPANMYRLISVVQVNGQAVDQHEQRFGFREVTIDGIYIRINGLRRNFWNLLACLKGRTSEEMLEHFRNGNNRFERFSEDLGLRKLLGPRRQQLEWTDTHGIPGRLSTMIDGMFINYDLTNPTVWENFREHVQQVVLAYRNHPSIVVYSLENELVLINGMLGYRGILDQVEAEAKRLVDIAHQLDPTRPCMLDGGGALKGNLLEVNCLHYPEAAADFYPENAYTLEKWGDFAGPEGRWIWDRKRPLAMGEISFFSGKNSEHAWLGGERVFLGRYQAKRAYAQYVRILLEGYRWNDVAIICPWVSMDDFPECWKSLAPLAAFVREYNNSFFAGEPVTRTVKVFNDTFSQEPLNFSWSVEIAGKRLAGETRRLRIDPGFGQELKINFTAPQVKKRTEAQLVLRVTREGEAPFEDSKTIAFFPSLRQVPVQRPVFVVEPQQGFSNWLSRWGIKASSIRDIAEVKVPNAIVLVAPDILTEEQANSETFANLARRGGRIIFLEQEHPLVNVGGTSLLKVTARQANYTFPMGSQAPLLAGLGEAEFSNWAGEAPTAKQLWEVPTGAAHSWVLCGEELKFSALLEVSVGMGLLIASQLRIGAKLDIEPAAQRLLANALQYADRYQPPSAKVILFVPQRSDIVEFMSQLGYVMREAKTMNEGLDIGAKTILVVHASRENLETLLRLRSQVDKFVRAGGWIMLWGLEPDGLTAFNTLLGTQHLLREFRLERVNIERDALTEGLSNRDVVQYTTEEIMHGDKWLSQEVFTYCVDGADIAPFCRLPGQKDEPYRPTKDDHDPYNLVNGMTGHDFWRYILQIWYKDWPPEGSPPFVFHLPVPCKIQRVQIWNNAYYDTIKDLEIRLDGQKVATIQLPDAMAPAEINFDRRLAQESVAFVVRSVRQRQDKPLVGIDNVQIFRELPDWYKGRVFPMVNVSGLVRYPRGKGGFVLNQLKLTGQDTPENTAKKRRIMAIILHNLGVSLQ